MKNNNFTLTAIVAVVLVTLLVTTMTVSSSLTNQVSAERDRGNSFQETAAQSCTKGPYGGNCQNLLGQLRGHDNSGTVGGDQPLESGP